MKPIAHIVIPSRHLTKVAFNKKAKIIVCGDDQGCISVIRVTNVISSIIKEGQLDFLNRILESNVLKHGESRSPRSQEAI